MHTTYDIAGDNTIKSGLLLLGIILCLVSLILGLTNYEFFSSWLVYIFMSGVPSQLVITMQMETLYPEYIARMSQPMRGIVMTLFTATIALVIATILFFVVGQGDGPPSPLLMHYMIMSVIVTFWVIPIMESWPFTCFTRNPILLGVMSLSFSYSLALVLFRLFFDFSAMAGEQFYVESLDPKGLFDAPTAISFFVTTNAVMLICLLTNQTIISNRMTSTAKQPQLGLITTCFILLVSLGCWWLFVKVLGIDRTMYMVRIPVCFIFGVFLVDPLMQHKALDQVNQPRRGLLLTLLAALMVPSVYAIYSTAGPILTGVELTSGAPGYQLETWVANALLGVTFPVIVVMAKYFDFWPIRQK